MRQLRLKSFLVTACLLIAASALISGTAWAKDSVRDRPPGVVVHIAIIDHVAFSEAAYNEVNEFISASLPSERLITFKVESSRIRDDRDSLRAQIIAFSKTALRSNEQITHLILDTHGATRTVDRTDDTTRLAVLGDFSDVSVGEDLLNVLRPFRGHMATDAVIVMNSCSTLCGTTAEASARARTLLNELGAENGQIYGSVTPEVERPGGLTGKFRIRDYFGDLSQAKLFFTMGAGLGISGSFLIELQSHALSWSQLPVSSFHAVLAAAGVSTALYAFTNVMKIALARFGQVNLGRIMIFRNGRLLSDRAVDKFKSHRDVYGLGRTDSATGIRCEKAFSTAL